MKKVYLWVAALLLIASSSALAQEKKLVGVSNVGESALMVLERERCDPLWRSKVLLESGLGGTTGREVLTANTPLYLTHPSCKLPAPPDVAEASLRLDIPSFIPPPPAPVAQKVPWIPVGLGIIVLSLILVVLLFRIRRKKKIAEIPPVKIELQQK